MTDYLLLRGARPGAIFARRGDVAISVAEFLADVAALAGVLPDHAQMINLCRDRYRFAVGFAAALCRHQINLLPPRDLPATLDSLTIDFPDCYGLTDTASHDAQPSLVTEFQYPETLARGSGEPVIPRFNADQAAAVLFTSGSTGRPRPHGRTWGELVASALAAGRRLGVGELTGGSLLGTVPHQHSYGLESLLLLALQHGLVLYAGRPFYPADIIADLAAAPRPRVLVTTPVHLRVLLTDPGELPTVDLLLSATAPLSVQLARDAEARFAVELHEIYGCSEAGQLAARRTALTEEWQCLDGITLRQTPEGTWASGVPIAVESLLSDEIELRDGERFLLRGRLADMINVAGKRTSLAHLNHQLNAIAGVRDGVFVASDDDGKDVGRLMAFVVAPGLTAAGITAALRQSIDPAFLPRPLRLVAGLPRNTLGKLTREEVDRLLAESRDHPGEVGPEQKLPRPGVPGGHVPGEHTTGQQKDET